MPAVITHELVAREAAELLSDPLREQVFRARGYYFLGAQGPDLFFFLRPLFKRESNLGKLLHRTHVCDWFEAMLRALHGFAGEDFEACFSYALGFCSHLAADTVFHPFVYNFLKETDAPRDVHQEIESDWDAYFLRELDGRDARRHAFPFDLGGIAESGVLYRFVAETAADIGYEVGPKDFRRMLKGFGLYIEHTHARHAVLLEWVGLGAFTPRREPSPLYLGGKDFFRLSEGRAKDADGLFLLAKEESALRMQAFSEAFNADMPLPSELFSRNMLTGKPL